MKIKVTEPLKDYEGNIITGPDEQVFTIRNAMNQALNTLLAEEVVTAEVKAKIYSISVKLWQNNEPDLTLDERVFIKERAGKISQPLVYGELCKILEEPEKVKQE